MLFFNGKLSPMKGWSLCVVSSKTVMWGALGAGEVIAGTSGKPRRASGGRLPVPLRATCLRMKNPERRKVTSLA